MEGTKPMHGEMSVKRAVGTVCVIFANLLVAPLYVSAAESAVRDFVRLPDGFLPFVALSIWVPIVYAWKRSPAIGITVQLIALACSVGWIWLAQPRIFSDIRQYAVILLLLTVGGAVAICGSPYACTQVKVSVICYCNCDENVGYVFTDVVLQLAGDLSYYNGPYASIKKSTVDKSVKDAASAIAHEYAYHINKAIAVVDGDIKAMEAKTFNSVQDCNSQCGTLRTNSIKKFSQTLAQTQAAENAKQ
jgi:hypothetical protein